MKKQINKGSFSLELIAIVVCVILVAVLSLRTYGGQISSTISETTNTIKNITDNVIGRYDGSEGNSPEPDIDMSNINIVKGENVLARGNFSTKGNVVTINNEQFKVLAVDGTMAKVMSLKNYFRVKYNDALETTTFGSNTGLKYADSKIDQALDSYYNVLPVEIQNAIIAQNIKQSMYSVNDGTSESADFSAWYDYNFNESSGTKFYMQKIAETNIGSRNVYILDMDEVIEYLGPVSTPQDLNEMFFNVRESYGRFVYLRSAYSGSSQEAIGINGNFGAIVHWPYNVENIEIHPAFIIDLSLVE